MHNHAFFTQFSNTVNVKIALLALLLLMFALAHPDKVFPGGFTDAEIEKAAKAYLDVIQVREDYHEKLEATDDPAEVQQIHRDAKEKIINAVVSKGISVDTYNDLIEAAQLDEALMSTLLDKIDALQ